MTLTPAQRRGIREQINGGELSPEQEIDSQEIKELYTIDDRGPDSMRVSTPWPVKRITPKFIFVDDREGVICGVSF